MIQPTSFSEICYVVHDVEKAAQEWARTVGAGPFYLIQPHDKARLYRGKPCDDPHRVALGNLGNAIGAATGLAALLLVSSSVFTLVKVVSVCGLRAYKGAASLDEQWDLERNRQ